MRIKSRQTFIMVEIDKKSPCIPLVYDYGNIKNRKTGREKAGRLIPLTFTATEKGKVNEKRMQEWGNTDNFKYLSGPGLIL